tara:strand:+ start:1555 stop:1755 length:201 start_codon:yes stop_codon:yes gene_type:complete
MVSNMKKDNPMQFLFEVITEDGVSHTVQAEVAKVQKRMVTFYVNKHRPFITARFLKYKSFKIKRVI